MALFNLIFAGIKYSKIEELECGSHVQKLRVNSLQSAKRKCDMDPNCDYLCDSKCNGKSPIYKCKANTNIHGSIDGSCIYRKGLFWLLSISQLRVNLFS